MKRAFELKNYESLIKEIGNNKFSELKILVTGDGRVAKGVLELLQKTNIILSFFHENVKNISSWRHFGKFVMVNITFLYQATILQ